MHRAPPHLAHQLSYTVAGIISAWVCSTFPRCGLSRSITRVCIRTCTLYTVQCATLYIIITARLNWWIVTRNYRLLSNTPVPVSPAPSPAPRPVLTRHNIQVICPVHRILGRGSTLIPGLPFNNLSSTSTGPEHSPGHRINPGTPANIQSTKCTPISNATLRQWRTHACVGVYTRIRLVHLIRYARSLIINNYTSCNDRSLIANRINEIHGGLNTWSMP